MPWIEQLRSAPWPEAIGIALGAFALGCFSTGYYLVRWRCGQDIRELGSGSVGARNVGRVLGWSGFLLTLAVDIAKGLFAVWSAQHFTREDWLIGLAMLAVVAGHIWPAQLRFRGGKGVATSLGALMVYDPHLALAFIFLCAASVALSRKSILPGLLAFGFLPVISAYLGNSPVHAIEVSCLSGLVLIAHRRNLIEEFTKLLERRGIHAKHRRYDL